MMPEPTLAMPPEASLPPEIFRRFCEIAYEKAGIAIKDGKEPLVSARVARRQRALGIASSREYLKFLESDKSGDELVSFLDAITTNFTSFFREPDHFTTLSSHVMGLAEEGANRLRLWCAASSSGEEPYTLAITLAEAFGDGRVDWRILASDLSTAVLAKAVAGEYSPESVESVPKQLRLKYFDVGRDAGGATIYRAKDALKKRIVFRRLNLIETPYPMSGPLDVIFCRNVMIYFDREVRQQLVSQMERLLAPGGLLVVAHTESLASLRTNLKMVRPSVYRK